MRETLLGVQESVPNQVGTNLIRRRPVGVKWRLRCQNRCESASIQAGISPRDPVITSWYSTIGRVHLLQSRVDEAILWFEKSRSANPGRAQVHAALASAFGLKGESKRAAAELAEARRLIADDRYSSIARLRASAIWVEPKIRALAEATFFAGLRKAGMPEE